MLIRVPLLAYVFM